MWKAGYVKAWIPPGEETSWRESCCVHPHTVFWDGHLLRHHSHPMLCVNRNHGLISPKVSVGQEFPSVQEQSLTQEFFVQGISCRVLREIGMANRQGRKKKQAELCRTSGRSDGGSVPVSLAGHEERGICVLAMLLQSTLSGSVPVGTWGCYSVGNPSKPDSPQLHSPLRSSGHASWFPKGKPHLYMPCLLRI